MKCLVVFATGISIFGLVVLLLLVKFFIVSFSVLVLCRYYCCSRTLSICMTCLVLFICIPIRLTSPESQIRCRGLASLSSQLRLKLISSVSGFFYPSETIYNTLLPIVIAFESIRIRVGFVFYIHYHYYQMFGFIVRVSDLFYRWFVYRFYLILTLFNLNLKNYFWW